MLFVHFERD